MKKLFSIWMAAVFAIFLSSGLSQPVQAANSASIAGTVTTASGALNVRSSASTSGKIVASLPRGSNVTLLSKSGSWWQVEYADGKYGYVPVSYTHLGYVRAPDHAADQFPQSPYRQPACSY